MIDEAGQIRRSETVVDVDHGYPKGRELSTTGRAIMLNSSPGGRDQR